MEHSFPFGKFRVVDLTKLVDPATETRRCTLYRFNTGGRIPDFHTNMDLMSHLGTHCECPYHHSEDWPDVSALPITDLAKEMLAESKEVGLPFNGLAYGEEEG